MSGEPELALVEAKRDLDNPETTFQIGLGGNSLPNSKGPELVQQLQRLPVVNHGEYDRRLRRPGYGHVHRDRPDQALSLDH
jgi:hypothetical protein